MWSDVRQCVQTTDRLDHNKHVKSVHTHPVEVQEPHVRHHCLHDSAHRFLFSDGLLFQWLFFQFTFFWRGVFFFLKGVLNLLFP